MRNKPYFTLILICSVLSLMGCEEKHKASESKSQQHYAEKVIDQADVLPYLNIKEQRAEYALPFCEKKNCIDIDIQTINTQDVWLNQWIAKNQAQIIQQQIDLNQNLSLQQAVNAFIKASDQWQAKYSKNRAYELEMKTRIASQRNQYVLLQIGIDSKIEELTIKDRQYFFVADRKVQKALSLNDILKPEQKTTLNTLVQQHYQDWLEKETAEVRKDTPKKLSWSQSDWFFDGEGIGIHYRAHEIAPEASQLDIYLNRKQTQQILKPEIYQQMF